LPALPPSSPSPASLPPSPSPASPVTSPKRSPLPLVFKM
jgi:hypothetical protein